MNIIIRLEKSLRNDDGKIAPSRWIALALTSFVCNDIGILMDW